MTAIAFLIVPKSRRRFTMKTYVAKHRTSLMIAAFAALAVGGVTLAHHAVYSEVKVTQLSQREIIEKLDGQDASATVVEVTFEPGQKDTPHDHAGPVFGYVLEGEYEHAIDDEPVTTYKAGDTFYEPSGSVHRVAANPSDKTRTRLLAVILHPRDVKEVTVPHKDHK
jgi:quercetin dioxygenase-like cupin family protein